MSSLQAVLPNGHMPASFIAAVPDPWFSQNPITYPGGPQGEYLVTWWCIILYNPFFDQSDCSNATAQVTWDYLVGQHQAHKYCKIVDFS